MYTVKHAAQLTGIPAATLRMWERRYGVVTPSRSDAGYRLYDENALRRLRTMGSLVEAGWSARQAAERVLAEDPGDEMLASSQRSEPSLGDFDALVRIAVDFDAAGLEEVLDATFGAASFEHVADGWLLPALTRVGDAWSNGEVNIAGEHFVSASVQRRLAAAYEAAGQPIGAGRVAVGLARGSRHELGILAFAVALRRCGLDVVYVGADLPVEAWLELVEDRSPMGVVLAAPTSDDVVAVTETVQAVSHAHPHVKPFVGGAWQAQVNGAESLGHSIGPAARSVASALGS